MPPAAPVGTANPQLKLPVVEVVPTQTLVPVEVAVRFQYTITVEPAGYPLSVAVTGAPGAAADGLSPRLARTSIAPQARAPVVRPTPV